MEVMTEALWLTATRPDPLLSFLREKVSYRKVVLFNCACCRRVWDLLGEKDRAAVSQCETSADEPHLPEVCDSYRAPVKGQTVHTTSPNGVPGVAFVPDFNWSDPSGESCLRWHLDGSSARHSFASAAPRTLDLVAPQGTPAERLRAILTGQSAEERAILDRIANNPVRLAEERAQADLVRDIFGNPFRLTVFALDWRTEVVLGLARELHRSRDFAALPILADALQDAGCDDENVLSHCRQAGPHALGCWVVDGLLGME